MYHLNNRILNTIAIDSIVLSLFYWALSEQFTYYYYLLVLCSLPATTTIPEFTRIPENDPTTIFSGIRVGICIRYECTTYLFIFSDAVLFGLSTWRLLVPFLNGYVQVQVWPGLAPLRPKLTLQERSELDNVQEGWGGPGHRGDSPRAKTIHHERSFRWRRHGQNQGTLNWKFSHWPKSNILVIIAILPSNRPFLGSPPLKSISDPPTPPRRPSPAGGSRVKGPETPICQIL